MSEPVSIARAPEPPIAPHVRAAWYLETAPEQPYERILPQPAAHLIVNLSTPYLLVRHGDERMRVPFAGAFLSGLQREHLVIENPPTIRQCGAEFSPAGIGALGPGVAARIAGQVIEAAEVIPAAGAWRDRLLAASGPEAALDAFVGLLGEALADAAPANPVAVAACAAIDADPDLPIAQLAERLGVTQARLLADMRAACGIPPKAYADLVRFRRFLDAIPFDGPAPRWSDLVAATGYYDQPHFIRSFKRFTGYTPSAYYAGVVGYGREFALFVPNDDA
jgi:AraC-like DNA-binding protein